MNPYITKEKADKNMKKNLSNTGHYLLAPFTAKILSLFGSFGSRSGNYDDYVATRDLAIRKGLIHPDMSFLSAEEIDYPIHRV